MFSYSNFLSNSLTGIFFYHLQYKVLDRYIKKENISQTIISLSHATLSSYMSISRYLNLISDQYWFDLSGFTFAYAIYDIYLINKIYKEKSNREMYLHHFLMIGGYLYPLYGQLVYNNVLPYYPKVISSIYLCEISTIFFNISYILNDYNKTNTTLFKYSSIGTVISYFFLRVCNFSYLSYYLFNKENKTPLLFMLPFTCLNYFWFYKIISRVNTKKE